MATEAYIDIDGIICSWLLGKGKSIHYYIKAATLATEAVRELSLTSLPLLHHTLITRAEGTNYFVLPKGYTDYVRFGVRYGDAWLPIPVADRLMPYPNSTGAGDLDPNEFSDDMNIAGTNTAWSSNLGASSASFDSASFGTGFNTTDNSGNALPFVNTTSTAFANWFGQNWYYGFAWNYGNGDLRQWGDRYAGLSLDLARGVVVCPENWPYLELYLVYTGVGTIDNMTNIPVIAQKAIETYMDWWYEAKKRTPANLKELKQEHYEQLRTLRARLNKLSAQDIINVFEQLRGRTTTLRSFVRSTP